MLYMQQIPVWFWESHQGMFPEDRAYSQPSESLGITPKQKQTDGNKKKNRCYKPGPQLFFTEV